MIVKWIIRVVTEKLYHTITIKKRKYITNKSIGISNEIKTANILCNESYVYDGKFSKNANEKAWKLKVLFRN